MITANEFINVLDIKNDYLYTKDKYILSFIVLEPLNIDLIPQEEMQANIKRFTASFEEDRKDFSYLFLPREINLDNYKKNLKNKMNNEICISGKKKILEEMLKECVDLTTSKENYEHQAYIKLWKKIGSSEEDSIRALKERTTQFVNRYKNNGFFVHQASQSEILTMCNLYANAEQTANCTKNMEDIYETALAIE